MDLLKLENVKVLSKSQQSNVKGGDLAEDCKFVLSLPPGGIIIETAKWVCKNAAEN